MFIQQLMVKNIAGLWLLIGVMQAMSVYHVKLHTTIWVQVLWPLSPDTSTTLEVDMLGVNGLVLTYAKRSYWLIQEYFILHGRML